MARLTDHEESWKYTNGSGCVGALRCMNNTDFEKLSVNDNIVLDVFIICQKLRHVQVI